MLKFYWRDPTELKAIIGSYAEARKLHFLYMSDQDLPVHVYELLMKEEYTPRGINPSERRLLHETTLYEYTNGRFVRTELVQKC